MTFTSIGYAGSVGWAEWAAIAKNQGADYSVAGAGDLAVTIADATAGTVRVAPGTASGRGITDTMNEAETIVTGLTTASTWYTVVLRRDWTPGPGSEVSTLVALAGGVTQGIAATRQSTIGTIDDQPIALVYRGTAGLEQVVDLRCWWGNGAMFAASSDALAYLGRDASVVRVGSTRWERVPGSAAWSRETLDMDRAAAGTLAVARGGTGATSAAAAREALGVNLANLGAAAAWPASSARRLSAVRTTSNQYPSGAWTTYLSLGLPSTAPAGLWMVIWTVLTKCTDKTDAYLRGMWGSTDLVGEKWVGAPSSLSFPTFVAHSGGAKTLQMALYVVGGTPTAEAGSRIDAVWMGP